MTPIVPAPSMALTAQYSHTVTSYVVVSVNGVQVGNFDQIVPGGTITVSTTGNPMATLSLSIIDPEDIWRGSSLPNGDVAPLDVMLQVYRTMTDAAGNQFTTQVGTFYLTTAEVTANSNGAGSIIVLTATDPSFIVSASIFENLWTVTAGDTLAEQVVAIMQSQCPQLPQFNLADIPTPLIAQICQPGQDPFAFMQSLATQVGAVLYFDETGVLTSRLLPAANIFPTVWFFDTTLSNSIVVSSDYSINDTPGYNGVLVTAFSYGGNSSTPITAVAWDSNPNSPTYYLGPYGKRPYNLSAQNIATQAQAQSMADLYLPLLIGQTVTYTLVSLPLQWVKGFDLVAVNDPNVPINDTFIVTGYTLCLDSSTATESFTLAPIGSPISQITAGAATPPQLPYPTYSGSSYSLASASNGGAIYQLAPDGQLVLA